MPIEKLVQFYERHGFVEDQDQPCIDAVVMHRKPRNANLTATEKAGADRSEGAQCSAPERLRETSGEQESAPFDGTQGQDDSLTAEGWS
jgi:hypothetical protein